MSYILDALRKSDQLRQRGVAPTLLTAPALTAAPKQPALAFYGLFAIALVGAGIAIGGLHPWQAGQSSQPAGPAAARPVESSALQADRAAAAPLLAEVTKEPQRAEPSRKAASSATASAKPAGTATKRHMPAQAGAGARDASPGADSSVTQKAARSAQVKAENADLGAAAQGQNPLTQNPLTIGELPLAIQQGIPRMSVAVHVYSSEPGSRMVSVNDRLLREGQDLAPGLKLEQITPEGMIFGYKGYRFRQRAH